MKQRRRHLCPDEEDDASGNQRNQRRPQSNRKIRPVTHHPDNPRRHRVAQRINHEQLTCHPHPPLAETHAPPRGAPPTKPPPPRTPRPSTDKPGPAPAQPPPPSRASPSPASPPAPPPL